jgi:hypothetical protein
LLYETIVDYFEVVENPVKRAEREKLLEWWNRYAHVQVQVIGQILIAYRQIFPNAKTARAAADARSETLKLLNGT